MQTLYFGFRPSPAFPLAPRDSVSFFASSSLSLYFRDFFRWTSRVKLLLIDLYFLSFLMVRFANSAAVCVSEKTGISFLRFVLFCVFLFSFGTELHNLSLALTNIQTRFYCVLNVLRDNGHKNFNKTALNWETDCQTLILSDLQCEKT